MSAAGTGAAMAETKLQQAVTFHNQGQLGRARMLYEEILRAEPRHFEALHLLGVVAAMSGDAREAVDLIERALEIVPGNAPAHNNRGAALRELGLWDAALESFERAASLQSDYAEPLYNRGNVLKDTGRWQAAVASYDRAIALRPDYAEAYCNRGICLAELGQRAAALASYDQALALNAAFGAAHYNRGNVLCSLRRWDQALGSYDHAVMSRPEFAQAHANRAFALLELGRNDEALASCDRAIALEPDLLVAHSNRAGVLLAMHRVEEALASYDRAISIDAQSASTYVNRGMARLLSGDFTGGWRDYEWRWKDRACWIIQEKRDFSQPLWLGEPSLAGRAILLLSEQGYGDTLQFCRYVPLLAARGARVILEVPEALANLMQFLPGVSRVLIQGQPEPHFDFYCPLLSLPFALGTRLDSIPADVPYLRAGDGHRHRWETRLGERRGRRVGLAWSGGFRPSRPELWSANHRRNLPLASLSALKLPGVEFYSLQKGEPAEAELADVRDRGWDGPEIRDLSREIQDFADTAALIEQLDLVISVDTAVAHLAGALGKPVWILNRFDTCWRWMLARSDSPWYPSATLYRQERAGDWEGVMRRVRMDLASLSSRAAE
jgi:tetratricopeptide (TPR) repeat protein